MNNIVLILEDDYDLVQILTFVLQQANLIVFSGTGQDYRQDISEHKPGLILLDHWLGGLLGSSICAELKANPETASIPVILLSAVAGVEQIALDCEADDFLEKPFDLADLEAKVFKWLTNS